MTAAELSARRAGIQAAHEADRRRKALASAERRNARDPRVPGRDHPLRNGGIYRQRPRQAGRVSAIALDLLALAALIALVLPFAMFGGWLQVAIIACNLLAIAAVVLLMLAVGARLMPETDDERWARQRAAARQDREANRRGKGVSGVR